MQAEAPKCPNCGRPVTKKGQDDGKTRYRCGQKGKDRHTPGCGWQGYDPVDLDVAEAAGLDPKATKAVARAVRAAGTTDVLYVITAAQNATPVHEGFFGALKVYCEATGAKLLVIPYRYKNPTSHWSAQAKHDDWWAPELAPYLCDQRIDLNANLRLLGDIKMQPTAERPLQGLESVSAGMSAIIGHPKLELQTVPTPQQKMPKILTTTGAVTRRNYINAKAGKKAAFHHTFGACVVELDGKRFHMRQINAVESGSFIDLNTEYTPHAGAIPAGQALALVMGDTHQWFVDPAVVAATFAPVGIVDIVNPKTLVWHDVCDFYSRNHHHRYEPFVQFGKFFAGRDSVERELRDAFALVAARGDGRTNVFVPSNHPDALARWVKETDPRTDPRNAVFWAETFTAMCKGTGWNPNGVGTIDPFTYWGKQWHPDPNWIFLRRGESYQAGGIELGYHGDKGPGGSRGTRRQYAKMGTKSIIGHTHAPGIFEGCYQVGTSSYLNLPYMVGEPSGWLHTHCVVYANGKRSLINIIDGAFHG